MSENIIKQQLNDAMKLAMRAQDKQRLGVIRLIQAAFKQVEVDERVVITDELALQIMSKMVKQRRDSIKQFADAKRDDLVAIEEYELTVLSDFLPAAMSAEDIKSCVTAAISETGASSVKDMSKVMEVLKPKLQGRADMGEVGKLIKTLLAV